MWWLQVLSFMFNLDERLTIFPHQLFINFGSIWFPYFQSFIQIAFPPETLGYSHVYIAIFWQLMDVCPCCMALWYVALFPLYQPIPTFEFCIFPKLSSVLPFVPSSLTFQTWHQMSQTYNNLMTDLLEVPRLQYKIRSIFVYICLISTIFITYCKDVDLFSNCLFMIMKHVARVIHPDRGRIRDGCLLLGQSQ